MDLTPDAAYRAIATRDPRFDGRVFIGVHTTGVYCRPVCPARTPRPENVAFYPSAAAAQEAGFRPCLRCRPESSPDLGAWRGTSNTVARALALIEVGALDQDDVEALANRLGVGERQLRRLFRRHLGASPVAVAQTRRVLLAKQLLHQTRLPMTEVALASGFGSVRRFNETFQALFQRPPAALRRAVGEAPAGADGVRLELPYRPPYDWDSLIAYLAYRAIPGVESVTPRRYARTLGLQGEAGLLEVSPAPGRDALRVTVRFPRLAALPTILARVRAIFDLTADPAAIAAHLSQDPALAPRVAARPGLRAPGCWDGFELAVRAVLGQQITVAAATNFAARLAAEYGEPLPADLDGSSLGLTRLFPTAARLAAADLSGLPMPRARSGSITRLAQAAVDNPRLFDPAGDLAASIAGLTGLPGIGAWTAHYIAMRALREPDAFPTGDVGLLRAMCGPDGARPSARALDQRARIWSPWRAYAAHHLWAGDILPDPLAGAPATARETSDHDLSAD